MSVMPPDQNHALFTGLLSKNSSSDPSRTLKHIDRHCPASPLNAFRNYAPDARQWSCHRLTTDRRAAIPGIGCIVASGGRRP